MKSDSDIKRDVEEELRFDPDIDATDIGVAVKDGVVTLVGFVKSYTEKFEAEAAAKRVTGVVGLANDLEVAPARRRRKAGSRNRARCRRRDQDKAAVQRGAHSRHRQGRLGDT